MTAVMKANLLVGIFVIAMAIASSAQTVSTIYQFNSGSNPNYPSGAMSQGQDGNFYGVTLSGNGCCQGIIYKISSEGALTSLYSMQQSDGTTCSGLTLGNDGNFYGACRNGGTNNYGTVFKVTSAGVLTVLHNFAAQGSTSDGCEPYAPPIQASNGDFYGTTAFCGASNYGTVYKLTLAGAYTLVYSFQGPPNDTALPLGLIEGTDGNLWGVGNGWIISGGGVFKLTLAGKVSLLYTFQPNSSGAFLDGENPDANLIQGSNGDFYGTTEEGGSANEGTIFQVTAGGKETVLYSFPNETDGAYPTLPLTQGPDGLLFGAATDCGGGGCSQAGLFDITTKGVYDNFYLYPLVCSNCGQPEAPLLLSTNGTFYSTTEQGGVGFGSFYSVDNGYSPFISLVTPIYSGKEGASLGILGQGFSSKSVVEFGGVKATTIKLSGTTFITATVPTGALTGDVTVTTGSTTLSTLASYKITPTQKSFTPSSGPVGTSVTITGTGLTQATKVTFDGTSASFKVVSDSEITATVPTGAKTGKIAVTTKGGVATSTTSFTVN